MRFSSPLLRIWARSLLRAEKQHLRQELPHVSPPAHRDVNAPTHGPLSQETEAAMDKLESSFAMYMAHTEPTKFEPKELFHSKATDAVLSHYGAVVSILEDLVSNKPAGTAAPYSPSSSRLLPSRKWNNLTADLSACETGEDFVQLFTHFFTHKRLSPKTAKAIVWAMKLQDQESLQQIGELVKHQGKLSSGWSETVIHSIRSEIRIKALAIEMRKDSSYLRKEQLKAFILVAFETVWFDLVKQGAFSARALRTLWYLVVQAENQFDVMGPVINQWGWSIVAKESSTSRSYYINAIVQMWIMATSTNNTAAMAVARNFLGVLLPEQYPRSLRFIFDFVASMPGNGVREAKQFAEILRKRVDNAPVEKPILLQALKISEDLNSSQIRKSGVMRLISDFAIDNKLLVQHEGKVSDARLLNRLKVLIEKDKGTSPINADLTEIIFHAG